MIRQLTGDCRVTLPTLEPGSVQSCITSPPYYGLRDYGTEPLVWGGDAEHAHGWQLGRGQGKSGGLSEKQITNAGAYHAPALHGFCECGAWLGSLGLEPTPELYIEHIVEVFRHVRRVLRDDGVLWLNLGDSYAGSGKGPSNSVQDTPTQWIPVNGSRGQRTGSAHGESGHTSGVTPPPGYKSKDLMMMPFRVAMALQTDGWWLRSVIPWFKRNSMPESVTDRPATAVEYVFLLSKASRYFWDADAVRSRQPGGDIGRKEREKGVRDPNPNGRSRRNSDWFFESWQGLLLDEQDDPLALVVNPAPFSGAHFATFPPKLVEPMVKASTSEKGQCPECGASWVRISGRNEQPSAYDARKYDESDPLYRTKRNMGARYQAQLDANPIRTTGWRPTCTHAAEPVPQTILDPFGGAGTVGLVADRLGRNAVLCELSDSYSPMAAERITQDAPLFTELETA